MQVADAKLVNVLVSFAMHDLSLTLPQRHDTFVIVTSQGLYTGSAHMIPMRAVNHRWIPGDIFGGNAALELVNTVSNYYRDPEDWIPDIASFLAWARTCGVLDEREQNAAARHANNSPPAAERVLP